MKELTPGHVYFLDFLKDPGAGCTFNFYMDEKIHGRALSGPSTQEVIRMCIARVKSLDKEKHWWGNRWIITLLRTSILLFELRALLYKGRKAGGIENLRTRDDGHVF
jgi:hypothetical protein